MPHIPKSLKKISVSVLLLATVASTFSVLLIPHGVEAYDKPTIASVFPADATSTGLDNEYPIGLYEGLSPLGKGPVHDRYITNAVNLNLLNVGSNYIEVTFSLDLQGNPKQAAFDVDKSTVIGDSWEDIGNWAAFYSPEVDGIPLENSGGPLSLTASGIFLYFGKGTEASEDSSPPVSPELTEKFGVIDLDMYIDFKATTQTSQKLKIVLPEFKAGETYYARIAFYESGFQSGYANGYSKFITFTLDAAGEDVANTTQTVTASGTTTAQTENDALGPYCLDFNPVSSRPTVNWKGCFANFFYVFWKLSAGLAELAGRLLDWFMGFSIQDETFYATSGTTDGFVTQGWALVRDLSNMLFIFILLYIAIGTILRLQQVDAKKMIGTLIIVALLINFSLFFAKVIVDASNVLAHVMYNAIEVSGDAGVTGKEKSITAALVSQFNPQQLFQNSDLDVNQHSGTYLIVIFVGIAMNVIMFLMFLKIAILFIGRVVGLMILMVFAPFAFTTLIIPGMRGWAEVGWSNWWKEFVKLAFLAPVFIFFLYLIILFLNLDFFKQLKNSSGDISTMGAIILLIVPFAIVYVLLMKARNIAVKMAGSVGEHSMAFMNRVGGAAVGAASGGVGFLGRQTLGRIAQRAASNESLKNRANQRGVGGWIARQQLKTYDATSKSSFDFVRKTTLGKGFSSQVGLTTDNAVLKGIGLGTEAGKGGFVGGKERRTQKQIDFAKKLEVSDANYDAMKREYEGKIDAKLRQNDEFKALAKEKFKVDDISQLTADQFKEIKNQVSTQTLDTIRKAAAAENPSEFVDGKTGELKSKAQINKERMDTYATALETPVVRIPGTNYDISRTPVGIAGDKEAARKLRDRYGADEKIDRDLANVAKQLSKVSKEFSDLNLDKNDPDIEAKIEAKINEETRKSLKLDLEVKEAERIYEESGWVEGAGEDVIAKKMEKAEKDREIEDLKTLLKRNDDLEKKKSDLEDKKKKAGIEKGKKKGEKKEPPSPKPKEEKKP